MADARKIYQLHVLVPPDEWHQFTRGIRAASDAEAIKRADEFWDKLVADPNLKLDRYVLQEGDRLVHERRHDPKRGTFSPWSLGTFQEEQKGRPDVALGPSCVRCLN